DLFICPGRINPSKEPGPCGSGSDAVLRFGGSVTPSALGDDAEPSAHQPDAVEVGLLPGALLGALAGLVALIEQFDLLQFLEGFRQQRLGILELDAQLVGGAAQVLPA